MASQHVVCAEDWKKGSVAIFAIEAGVDIMEMGQRDLKLSVNEVPTYVPGLLIAKSEGTNRVSMLASNGVLIDFKGAGYFAIERFEQEALGLEWLDAKHESGQSRMILNLRAGTLIVDQRKLLNVSQAALEAPVGRFSGNNDSLWMIQLSKDARKRTYSFNVYCVQGTLRYIDLTGRTFTIRSGQRITGAGSALNPSVEVAAITSDAQEYLDDYLERVSALKDMGLAEEGFLSATKKMRLDGVVEDLSPLQKETANVIAIEARPVVIEYAPRSAPVTPFQGVARPPSVDELDLF
ncbi:MAG: hypothetical protein ACN4GF_09005 [Lentimonas sp.]